MTYYHATTREKLPSIQRWGLGGTRNVQKNFDCLDGVYLVADPMLALGFLIEKALGGPFLCKTPKDCVAAFVVIVIDGARIDERRLSVDPNIKKEGFWIFNGIVDVTSMPVIDADQVMQFSQPAEKWGPSRMKTPSTIFGATGLLGGADPESPKRSAAQN